MSKAQTSSAQPAVKKPALTEAQIKAEAKQQGKDVQEVGPKALVVEPKNTEGKNIESKEEAQKEIKKSDASDAVEAQESAIQLSSLDSSVTEVESLDFISGQQEAFDLSLTSSSGQNEFISAPQEDMLLAQRTSSKSSAKAASSKSVAEASAAQAAATAGGLSMGAVLGLTVLGGAALSGGGGSSSSSAQGSGSSGSTPAAAAPTLGVQAGPVLAGNDLYAQVYDAKGNKLGSELKVSDTGEVSLSSLSGYSGAYFVKVYSKGGASDYTDEATGQAKDLGAQVILTAGHTGMTSLNANPVTTVAALKAGITLNAGQPSITKDLTVEEINAANKAVAKAHGLSDNADVTQIKPDLVNDASYTSDGSNAAKLGMMLAFYSAQDASGSLSDTITQMANHIDVANQSMKESGKTFLSKAAFALQSMSSETWAAKANDVLHQVTSTTAKSVTIDPINGGLPIDVKGVSALTVSGTATAGEFVILTGSLFGAATETLGVVTADAQGKWSYTISATLLAAITKIDQEGFVTLNAKLNQETATSALWVDTKDDAPEAVILKNIQKINESDEAIARTWVADIAVKDDINKETATVYLKGADAAFFEIVGQKLYLKAGTLLNFDLKSEYNVTVAAMAVIDGISSAVKEQTFTLNIQDANRAPVVSNTISAQKFNSSSLTYQIAADAFRSGDITGDQALTYAASLADGTALPTWLSFDASTRQFTATSSTAQTAVSVKVVATDAGGLSTSTTFDASFVLGPQVSTVSAQDSTTSNTGAIGKADEIVTLTVKLTENVTSTSKIKALFNINGQDVSLETATAANNTDTLTFDYTITSASKSGTKIELKSLSALTGTIKGSAAIPIESITTPIALSTLYEIDTTAPVVSSKVFTAKVNETGVGKLSTSNTTETLTWALDTAAGAGFDNGLFNLNADGTLSFKAAKTAGAYDDVYGIAQDGTYGIKVIATDLAGNVSASTLVNISVLG